MWFTATSASRTAVWARSEARQVAANINAGQGRLHVFVHHDAAAFGLLQVEVLQPETLRHGAATHAHQQPFGHDRACTLGILIPHLYLPAFGHGQRNDLRAEHEFHAALGIVGPQEGGEFFVHAATPRLLKNEANSMPMTPPPMMASDWGSSLLSSASRCVQ